MIKRNLNLVTSISGKDRARIVSKKFPKFHGKKTLMMKSFLSSVTASNILRRTPSQMFSYDFCKFLRHNTYEQHFLNK